ncbi:HAMP domain-containing histidine kinase [Bacteroides sp. OttesenSCG-928-D19]|nr:HAMP domain-containing histidine kinase [Bacteroides sp. OttesenSCG-928-N06]MDL2305505.1 HAMP domain-containing histidine kinase [Bacteroides sp. OttesenSCG-928-D19]
MNNKVLICLLLLWAVSLKAENTISEDSLMAYYAKHLSNPTHPKALAASDTLLELSRQARNPELIKIALAAKIDYYFYGNDENAADSMFVWIDRAKNHALEYNDQTLYYWLWSARLVAYYVKSGEYNTALIECEKMLSEAERSNYKEGIAECYLSLADVYNAKGLPQKAQEFMLKEIELFEEHNLKRPHITFQYSDAAKIYIDEGQLDAAFSLLEKAIKYARTPYHKVTAKLAYASYYLAKNNIDLARSVLDECEQIYEKTPVTRRHIHYYYSVEIDYYQKVKNYDKALYYVELKKDELEKMNDSVKLLLLEKTKADILWDMGRKEDASLLYRNVLDTQEKEKEKNEEITTGEFATLLNLQKLNAEKQQLEEISREKQLQNTRLITVSLTVLLLVLIFFLYHQRKMNRKLNHSRNELDRKNQILLQAEAELIEAKELAENSSRMKTVFIQNMSHEIRTPLNSIVGFSAVLADLFATEENEDVVQFASLIESNSQLLLRLINDILDISDLDNNAEMIYRPTDINDCCLIAIEETKPLLKNGVNLLFEPEKKELMVNSSPDRIVQVLRNLLSNAAKFTSVGTVSLAYEVDEAKKQIFFTVTDTGVGIPVGEEEHIFERFVKLDEFVQGVGLGLSISRIVAEKMGGYLMVDRNYTQGSRFVFCIAL